MNKYIKFISNLIEQFLFLIFLIIMFIIEIYGFSKVIVILYKKFNKISRHLK